MKVTLTVTYMLSTTPQLLALRIMGTLQQLRELDPVSTLTMSLTDSHISEFSVPHHHGDHAIGNLGSGTFLGGVYGGGGGSLRPDDQAFPGKNDFATRDTGLGLNSDYIDHCFYFFGNRAIGPTQRHDDHTFHEPGFSSPAVNPVRGLDQTLDFCVQGHTNPMAQNSEDRPSAFSYTSTPSNFHKHLP